MIKKVLLQMSLRVNRNISLIEHLRVALILLFFFSVRRLHGVSACSRFIFYHWRGFFCYSSFGA